MKSSVINIKVEPQVKLKAQKRAKAMGVPLSAILRIMLINFVNGEEVKFPEHKKRVI